MADESVKSGAWTCPAIVTASGDASVTSSGDASVTSSSDASVTSSSDASVLCSIDPPATGRRYCLSPARNVCCAAGPARYREAVPTAFGDAGVLRGVDPDATCGGTNSMTL